MASPDGNELIDVLVEAGLAEKTQTISAEATDSGVENQPTRDPQPVTFTWTIENFSMITSERLYSGTYKLRGYEWRILIRPMGYIGDLIALFLEVPDSSALPYGWTRRTHFSLAIINQVDSKNSFRRVLQYQFNAGQRDWGTSFMPRAELLDPSRGYLVNDTCVVEAKVVVYEAPDPLYDSKKETGFVGLKNQGATCYMNSLLQTLYHIPFFRKVVYDMPTNINDMPSAHIPLALQRLFYDLQYNDESVVTEELTKSFGWDTGDAFRQHDVQEFNRLLCEKLEEKMKGTAVEGSIQRLFEGHIMSYITCINVNYQSRRTEPFYDLQLDVKGCQDVYASFDKYVAIENLDGDNKYQAGSHGLQDARKGVLFTDFPPVLQLHLKRFEYDFGRNVKINDRFEFPLQLDLDRGEGKYLSPDADRRVRNLYTLHSVLVHSGGVDGGHYYVFIRPALASQWYKFDDERVTKEDTERALDDMYGGEESTFKLTRHSNAYMLVYIRELDKDIIMCHVDERDIADHLTGRLKSKLEEKERKKKEKAEAAYQYTTVKVACDEDLRTQIGKKVFFDLVDYEEVKSFRVQNLTRFNVFKEDVAKEFCVPSRYLRFWLCIKRENNTHRPFRPLTEPEEDETVGRLRNMPILDMFAELKLFLEFKLDQDLRPVPLPNLGDDDILLFFKLYDPEKEELRYVGRLFLKRSDRPIEILPRLKEMAGFAPDEDLELYEESGFDPVMCEYIELRFPFSVSLIEDGDILCIQKYLPEETWERLRFPDPWSFFEHRRKLQGRPPLPPPPKKSMKIG